MTEVLAKLEGMERGPAGNTSLAVAFSLAQSMREDQIVVVQETEYTGAGKHMNAQLSFAKKRGIKVITGDPKQEIAGENIVLPSHPGLIQARPVDLDQLRYSYLRNQLKMHPDTLFSQDDILYLSQECNTSVTWTETAIRQLKGDGYETK